MIVDPQSAEIPDPEQIGEQMKEAVERVRELVARLKAFENEEKATLAPSYPH